MSSSNHVKFSIPIATTRPSRPEPHPLDSGLGSSSSEHTGSSGSLDESFTARDYDIQSNSVDALREALHHATKDIARLKDKYHQQQSENDRTHKAHRDTTLLYRKQCEQVKDLENRLYKRETALSEANARIKALELEISQYKSKYTDLHERYQAVVNSTDSSTTSGGSGDRSNGSKKYLENDITEIHRLKERLNRDQETANSKGSSKTSHSSGDTSSSKRTGASISGKPYIEKMPAKSNNHSNLVSPREPGTFNLTTATNQSRRHVTGTCTASIRRPEREHGNYIAHPLPDRK